MVKEFSIDFIAIFHLNEIILKEYLKNNFIFLSSIAEFQKKILDLSNDKSKCTPSNGNEYHIVNYSGPCTIEIRHGFYDDPKFRIIHSRDKFSMMSICNHYVLKWLNPLIYEPISNIVFNKNFLKNNQIYPSYTSTYISILPFGMVSIITKIKFEVDNITYATFFNLIKSISNQAILEDSDGKYSFKTFAEKIASNLRSDIIKNSLIDAYVTNPYKLVTIYQPINSDFEDHLENFGMDQNPIKCSENNNEFLITLNYDFILFYSKYQTSRDLYNCIRNNLVAIAELSNLQNRLYRTLNKLTDSIINRDIQLDIDKRDTIITKLNGFLKNPIFDNYHSLGHYHLTYYKLLNEYIQLDEHRMKTISRINDLITQYNRS